MTLLIVVPFRNLTRKGRDYRLGERSEYSPAQPLADGYGRSPRGDDKLGLGNALDPSTSAHCAYAQDDTRPYGLLR